MASSKIKGINIKIGADTRGLNTALKNIESKSKSAKNKLFEINKSIKSTPNSLTLWRQKQEILTKAIEDSREKVKMLEDAQDDIEKQLRDGKINGEQYRAFQRELENARSEFSKLENQLQDTNKKIYDFENGTENGRKGDDILPLPMHSIGSGSMSHSLDTLQNIKVGKNGEISTERAYISTSTYRTMLVKSTAEPIILYDLETSDTYILQAEKLGYKTISPKAGFLFNANGKIIDPFFNETYDGNFTFILRPIKLTIQSTEGLKLEIHAPENSVFNGITGNVNFTISDDKKVLTYTVGTENTVFTFFYQDSIKYIFLICPTDIM